MAGKPFGLNQIKKIVERTAQRSSTLQNMNEITFGIANREQIEKQQENEGPTL